MWPLTVTTYLADREVKNYINGTYRLGARTTHLDGKVILSNVHNKKTMADHLQLKGEKAELFTKGSILFPLLYFLLSHTGKKNRLQRISAALLLGGSLGNWVERLENGYVTDYLTIEAGPLKKIAFNLADVAIVFGAILGFISLFRRKD